MEESTGEGGWPEFKRKYGRATNYPRGAVFLSRSIYLRYPSPYATRKQGT